MRNSNNKNTSKKPNGGLKEMLGFCEPHRVPIIIAMIFAILGSIFSLVGPNQISKITTKIIEGAATGIDLEYIGKIGVFLVILYLLGFLFNYAKGFLMAGTTQKISNNLRNEISRKINRLPFKYFDNVPYGDVLSRVTNDVDSISQSLNSGLIQLITSATMFLGSLIMMFTINITMTMAAVFSTLIGFGLMFLIMSKSQKYFINQQKEIGAMNGYIEEIYSGHNVVKLYNATKKSKKIFSSINDKLYTSAWKSQFLSGLMMPLMNFIGNFGYVAVCVVGAALTLNGKIEFGVIVAFMIYIRQFTNPLSQLAQVMTNLQSATAASKRVFEFLNESEMDDESHKTATIENVQGEVEFKNVKFGYNKDQTIIHDFSAIANKGQKVAIVGPTGAGKTTLVNLLMRFYEIDNGEILIDGVPISSMKREDVHNLFCMVLQDTWLFEGSIKQNIIYSKDGVSDEEVVMASKAVGLHHFVRTLPHGYDTVLDDKTTLSAGQKQQITIARAIIKKAPLLILDEATSSVDTRTELLVQRAMDELMKGRTSFVIAHRLSTIKNADLILVMKDGDIIESGNHEELLGKNGFYADLYNSQFEQVG